MISLHTVTVSCFFPQHSPLAKGIAVAMAKTPQSLTQSCFGPCSSLTWVLDPYRFEMRSNVTLSIDVCSESYTFTWPAEPPIDVTTHQWFPRQCSICTGELVMLYLGIRRVECSPDNTENFFFEIAWAKFTCISASSSPAIKISLSAEDKSIVSQGVEPWVSLWPYVSVVQRSIFFLEMAEYLACNW